MGETDRLRWSCRRGLLELDLILQGFLERHLEGLDAGERGIFRELLEFPDNDLLDWAMGRQEPDPRYLGVVRLLRTSL
jgi:antitoxin CptB